VATLTLEGTLDAAALPAFRQELTRAIASKPLQLVLRLEKVQTMSGECARAFMFAEKDLDVAATVYVVGANAAVKDTLQEAGALDGATIQDIYEAPSLTGAAAG
jgi:anti-anti-sigma factor